MEALTAYCEKGLQHIGLYTKVVKLALVPHLDDAGERKFTEVMGDGRLRNTKTLYNLTAGLFALICDQLQDFKTARIGQRFGDHLKLCSVHFAAPSAMFKIGRVIIA